MKTREGVCDVITGKLLSILVGGETLSNDLAQHVANNILDFLEEETNLVLYHTKTDKLEGER